MNALQAPTSDGRVWANIDLDALSDNVREIRSKLHPGCEFMAVVKADAYGHGAVEVSARLRREGVNALAVATVSEAVQLRQHRIDGDILVLGYTHPVYTNLLTDYDLIQLVVDEAHAKALNEEGQKLRVHLAVDTGMHRLGIAADNITELENIYNNTKLSVEGVASHLASSDSMDANDVDYTDMQIKRFFNTVNELKSKGYNTGKVHIQASYGMVNRPDLPCDYVRMGIAMYGVQSSNEAAIKGYRLRPVLSLQARVAQVRGIDAGESVSYGRAFIAEKPIKLATISVGYADGIPRQASGKGMLCIADGRRIPVIGRICMDLLMVDATDTDLKQGDTVTIIGREGNTEIRCEDLAEAAGTITNDILCRLGSRVTRIYV